MAACWAPVRPSASSRLPTARRHQPESYRQVKATQGPLRAPVDQVSGLLKGLVVIDTEHRGVQRRVEQQAAVGRRAK